MSTAGVALSSIREDLALLPGHLGRGQSHCSQESILIYLSVAGSVIPMSVLESDSIASVKLQIQTCKGFVVKKQRLVFGGRELARNESLVRDYGVTDGNVLHLVLRLSDLQVITVRMTCDKELKFHVERSRNVGYIKQQIAKRGKGFVNLNNQELICNGEKLNDQRLIDDICKDNDVVIHLVVQKSAKDRGKPIEKDFELSIDAANWNESRVDKVDRSAKVRAKPVEEIFELSIDAPNRNESRVDKVDREKSGTRLEELHLVPRKSPHRDFWLEPVIINPKVELSAVIEDLIKASFAGLEKGYFPIRSSEGSGGAYFMQDSSGQYIGIFKPIDEEPMAVNNPQGLPLTSNGEGLKRGTRVGEGALREVAAYILDHPRRGCHSFLSDEIGFSGVPPTVMIRCLHKAFNHPQGYEYALKNFKIGSLQVFVKNCGSCEDMGPRAFPVEEVHKISVLDIRLANADRHAGNILVCKAGNEGQIILVPIDHGYCLPEKLGIGEYPLYIDANWEHMSLMTNGSSKQGYRCGRYRFGLIGWAELPIVKFEDCTFDWLYWPQARQPYSAETIEYIKLLDAEQDIALLKFHGWELSLECKRTFRISTMLLKKGVERGLTPFAIGSIMCRETLKKESIIEEIVNEAQETVLPGMNETAFLESVSEIMDRRLDELII